MLGQAVRKLGLNRGHRRLWLEGRSPALAGFVPGCRYSVRRDGNALVLEVTAEGDRTVSGKAKGAGPHPVIDICSNDTLAPFQGSESVRVTFHPGRIVVTIVASEERRLERAARLASKLATGERLAVGSVCHGGGVLSHALHTGLGAAGIGSRLAFAVELRPELLDHAASVSEAWDEQTLALGAPLQEAAFDLGLPLPVVEVLEMGLPCSGASVAGRAKRGLALPEDHEHVGFLAAAALALVARVNPAVVVLENVPGYASSGSASIIRGQLKDWGYQVSEQVLSGQDFGALQARNRWVLVAVTAGAAFDFASLVRSSPTMRLGDVLDPVADDAPCWSPMAGLKAKQARDLAAGKHFKMQTVTALDTKCPTITKGYMKNRSTDPKLAHPRNPDLLRLFTPAEHARIASIPERLVSGIESGTLAHEVLGQSVVWNVFRELARAIGSALGGLGDVGGQVAAQAAG